MNPFINTPMPHFEVHDDGILPSVVEHIFKLAQTSKQLNSILNVIKDRSFQLSIDWSDGMVQICEQKGFILADTDEEGRPRILSLIDAINMVHSEMDEHTFYKLDEASQDTLMHFGFEQYNYMSILECCTLSALALIDQTDVFLYRDYSNYTSGYVKHFLTTALSDKKEHMLVMNISKTIGIYLTDHELRLSVKQKEKFALKVFELIEASRKSGSLPILYLQPTDHDYASKFEKLLEQRTKAETSLDVSALAYYKSQMRALVAQNKFELAAYVRMKIKEIEKNNI
jgi:hypothetical protein